MGSWLENLNTKVTFQIIFLEHEHDDQRAMDLVCIERALRYHWSFDVRLRCMCGRSCNLFGVQWPLLENLLRFQDCRYFHCRHIQQEFHLHCSSNRFQQLSCLLNDTKNILFRLFSIFKLKPTEIFWPKSTVNNCDFDLLKIAFDRSKVLIRCIQSCHWIRCCSICGTGEKQK